MTIRNFHTILHISGLYGTEHYITVHCSTAVCITRCNSCLHSAAAAQYITHSLSLSHTRRERLQHGSSQQLSAHKSFPGAATLHRADNSSLSELRRSDRPTDRVQQQDQRTLLLFLQPSSDK